MQYKLIKIRIQHDKSNINNNLATEVESDIQEKKHAKLLEKRKAKTVPVTGHGGPYGCETL
jgi:hypothetical protein